MSVLQLHQYSETKNPKYLVILLHGYGANGENLLELAHELKHVLPEAHYIAPNACQNWEGGFPNSYQWFSLSNGFERKSLEQMSDNVKEANQTLSELVKTQLKKFNLSSDKLFLIGFSQGAMMAIYQALTMDDEVAAVISFSGKVILPEMLGQKTINKPEICLIHGDQDSVVPFTCLSDGQEVLKAIDIKHQAHAIEGLEHSIDLEAVNAAKTFIKNKI